MKKRCITFLLLALFLFIFPVIAVGVDVKPALHVGDVLTITDVTDIDGMSCWYSVRLYDGSTAYIRSDSILAEMTEDAAYIGNANSKVFHRPTCRNLPSEKNAVCFSSRDEAIERGYTPCGNCDP